MKKVEKAGGIVVNTAGLILLVTNYAGRVSLPKGGLEPGESHRDAASREVMEEGGLPRLTLICELGTIERLGFTAENTAVPSALKRIKMYLFKTDELVLQPNIEDIISAEWVDPDEVKNRLTWDEEIHFFEQHRGDIQKLIDSTQITD